jgi:hypothetical protein
MTKKSLCQIFGIKYEDTFYDIVLSHNPRVEYKAAKKLLEETHGFSSTQYSTTDSSLIIEKTERDGTKIVTQFIPLSNCESLRGRTIRNAYIEHGLENTEFVQWYVRPCARNIIKIT